ncbi:MAG TPA: NAD(P)/FAD-dependent oxidoreductase [Polyangiaceae bacterium]|nr:NAD(P)/FAD-dependent oxidoreductase [Polyangiaceae bacterium]
MRALDVGIVGCGFAGAATAALLGRAGHRVTVYEEFAQPSAVGAGIVLQPTGMSVLAELGVLGQVIERGARLESLHCVTHENRDVFRLDYAQLHPDLFGLGMHRGALFQILHERAVAAGATLHRATSIGRVVERPKKAEVRDHADRPIAEHDLVVIANGARSDLRRASGLLRRERPYPWGALWFVARDPGHFYRHRLRQISNGTRHMLGLLPTGLGPRGEGPDEQRVSLFWSIRMDRVADYRRAGFTAWKEQILRYEPEAAFVLDQIESEEQVLSASYHDVVMSSWHTRRRVFIGDAAHAMSPQLGQGTNLALMDASQLCTALAQDVPLEIALERYSRARRAQIDYYQFASRWLTPLFQSDLQGLGPLRNALMRLACQMPIMRQEMLRTMAGIKQGVVGPSLVLPAISAAQTAN